MTDTATTLPLVETNTVNAATEGWSAKTKLALGSLAVSTFALVFTEFLPAGLLTPMAANLGISQGTAGQAVTATAIAGTLSGLLVGTAIGRTDRKLVLLVLSALAILSNIAATLAPSFVVLVLARVIIGIAVGGYWSLAGAVVARIVSVEAIGKGMAIILVGVSLATISAAPLAALIAEYAGWRMAFALGIALASFALLAQLFALPRLPASESVRLGVMFGLLRRPMLQIALIAILAVAGGHFAGYTYVRPVLEGYTHMAPMRIAEVLLAFGIANFLGNLVAGMVVDRWLGPSLTLTGLLLGAAALTLLAFGAGPLAAAGSVILWGFAFGAAPLVLQTWTVRATPDHIEASGGLLVAAFQIAIASGAAIGGLIVDHASVTDVLIFTGVVALGAAFLPLIRVKAAVIA
ncbi:MAG TPA: MFS transporter [Magnetospirillaceae bacterium]|jgi:DHA1 family purine ribonucleoside efflux pump-like MFS transporter